jgi:creatinine amidohydrolase
MTPPSPRQTHCSPFVTHGNHGPFAAWAKVVNNPEICRKTNVALRGARAFDYSFPTGVEWLLVMTKHTSGPVLWERLTWEEIGALHRQGMDMAILPVGATEQHGPHLALEVDTLSATRVAQAVSELTGVRPRLGAVHRLRPRRPGPGAQRRRDLLGARPRALGAGPLAQGAGPGSRPTTTSAASPIRCPPGWCSSGSSRTPPAWASACTWASVSQWEIDRYARLF